MEGLGYGEVDMGLEQVRRLDELLAERVREINNLRADVYSLKNELALLKQQQPATVHHHYHGAQSPLYEGGKTYYKGGSGLGGATA